VKLQFCIASIRRNEPRTRGFLTKQGSLLLTLMLALVGCSQRAVQPRIEEPYPKRLSEWHLFTASAPHLRPNSGVVPYDLNTPLFSDYADKYRFLWIPRGAAAHYRADGILEFPVGTILAKTFAFPGVSAGKSAGADLPEHLIETRLLIHAKSGWVALPYVWDSAGHDATL
jgi:hypothetical protein